MVTLASLLRKRKPSGKKVTKAATAKAIKPLVAKILKSTMGQGWKLGGRGIQPSRRNANRTYAPKTKRTSTRPTRALRYRERLYKHRPESSKTKGGLLPFLVPLGIGLASAVAGAIASKGLDVIDRKVSGKGMPIRGMGLRRSARRGRRIR